MQLDSNYNKAAIDGSFIYFSRHNFFRMRKYEMLCIVLAFFLPACNNADTPEKEPAPVSEKVEWTLVPFTKIDSLNPILTAGTGEFTCPILKRKIKWENKDVFNPAVIAKDGKVFMLYRAEDTIGKYAGTSRLGLAESSD